MEYEGIDWASNDKEYFINNIKKVKDSINSKIVNNMDEFLQFNEQLNYKEESYKKLAQHIKDGKIFIPESKLPLFYGLMNLRDIKIHLEKCYKLEME